MSTARTTIIFMLLVIAGLVTYAGPRLQLPKPRLMPVKELPRQIGDWTAVTDRRDREGTRGCGNPDRRSPSR